MRLLAITTLLIALLAGCSFGKPVIDGYPIGERASCPDGCPDFIHQVGVWLEDAVPDHPPVATIELFHPDYGLQVTRSGSRGDYVAVISFVDGTVRAVQVGCGVGVEADPCFTTPPLRIDR